MRMQRRWLLGMAFAAIAANGARADDAATPIDEVVVTGARLEDTLPQTLAQYGSSLETIDADTVRRNAYVDVSQALQMQTPGLFVSPRNGPFSYADIALQGSRTGDVLWLVDSVRINNRLYTSTSPADTLPASMVERIEVLKGGQSLFYGAQAAAGVINVVTRAYSDRLSGDVTLGGDTNRGVNASAMVRGALGPSRFVSWISKDESDGYRTFDVVQPSATARRRGYDVGSLGGKLGLDLGATLKANLYYQHTDAHLDYPAPRLTRLSFNDRDEEIASASLDWTASDRVQLSVKGYFHDWDSVYSTVNNVPGAPGAPPVIVDDLTYWGYEDYGVSVLAKIDLTRGFQVDLGYDLQNFNGRDEVLLIASQTQRVQAVIAQVRTTDHLIADVRLSAGVRFDRTDDGDNAVWNVSGRWDVTPGVYVQGSLGTSFILPSAEQLYAVDPCCAVGDAELGPEQSLNGNVAIGGAGRRYTWQVTAFARKIDDLIVDVYDRPEYPDGVYVNVQDSITTRGLELSGTAQLSDALSARASYAYTRTRAAGAGRQFDRIPKAQAKAVLQYDPADRPIGASANLSWTGDVFQTVSGFGRVNYGGFAVADLAAHVFLDKARKQRVTARVENVFDRRYATRVNSALADLSTRRFLYRFLGVPRTLHVSYDYSF